MKGIGWVIATVVLVYLLLARPRAAAGGKPAGTAGQPPAGSGAGYLVGKIIDGAVALFKSSPDAPATPLEDMTPIAAPQLL